MEINRKELVGKIIISVVASISATAILFLLGLLLDFLLALNIPSAYLMLITSAVSVLASIWFLFKTYEIILIRLNILTFLQENSATRSFELFIDILKRLIIRANIESIRDFERDILPDLQKLIEKRRQPMQIIQVDLQRLIEEAKQYGSEKSVAEQMLYYLDFMAAYKRMAMPRIVRQAVLYMEAFGAGEMTDYVVIYGHSTVVVNCVIAGYKVKPFPVIVVEDLQYHHQSLGEHRLVCNKLRNAKVPFTLIKFEQIQDLFNPSAIRLTSVSGESLPLLRKRRMHVFMGCERIDVYGNCLIPSELKGVPSESAQFLQEIEAYSKEKNTSARIIIFAESYKVRNFDKISDSQTHAPLKGNLIQSILYITGIRRKLPSMQPISLFTIDSGSIFAHVNELGIFPNVAGKFDLRYCENVFESETNVVGFFSKPLSLKYKIFDEIMAILFDFNGVIVDDEQIHFAAFAKVLNEIGINFTFSDYQELCFGRSNFDGLIRIKKKYAIDANVQDLMRKKHDAYFALISSSDVKAFSGVHSLLRALRNRGYKIGLVTASDKQEVEPVLHYLKINDYFDVIISDGEVDESKPSAQGYLLAAERLKVPISRCLVIEDSPAVINNVSRLGMRTVGIRHQKDVSIENADFLVNSLEELMTP